MRVFLFLLLAGFLLTACSREDNDVRDVQREESFGHDDFRENDNYERTVPLEPDEKAAP